MLFDQLELLDKSPLGIVICDKDQRIKWCNPLFLHQTQLTSAQVIEQLYPALPLEAIDKDAQLVQLFDETGSEDCKFQYWHGELSKPAGYRVHYFAKQRQQSNKMSLAAAKLAAGRLPKRANWVEFLDYEVSRSRRYDNPLSILKLHLIVHAKPEQVNQETINQTIRDTLTDELRWADMIGHTDQGTFLLVLPETPQDALDRLQEKLNKALHRQITFISDAIDYQVVFGGACWQKQDDSQRLLQRARSQLVAALEKLLD